MRPEDLSEALSEKLDEGRIRQSTEKAVQASMKGVKARGHQMSMQGTKVRVYGPAAPAVAKEAGSRMSKAAVVALREALR